MIYSSFVASAGLIKPSAVPMVFSDKGLGKEDTTWTFGFRPDHDIPANGYLQFVMPDEIKLEPGQAMKTGFCA